MAEILHFEILRKHGQTHKQTHKTHKQTDMGITIPRPPPMGGRSNYDVACIYKHRPNCRFAIRHLGQYGQLVHICVISYHRCNRLSYRCPLARMSGLQCINMGHKS